MGRDKLLNIPARTYHKEYYKRNKELIRAKRMLTQENIVSQNVRQWKIDKMNDPWAFNPFYDPNAKVRYAYGELLDVSGTISIICMCSPNTECGTA
jgi:hypothetical protein